MMFSSQTIAALVTGGLLCIMIPIAALIIFKIKNKTVPVSAFFIGCGTFIIFAMILESALHAVMLPLVTGSTVLYVIYGCLAAGVFEETGRFLAFKTVMKNRTDPKAAIMYGLGHGGAEAILLAGITFLSFAVVAVSVNTMGIDAIVESAARGDAELAEVARAQIEGYTAVTFGSILPGVFERLIAMTFHTAISVIVFESARVRGRFFLYPVCILLHALLDAPAALYQTGALPLGVVYPILAVCTAVTVYLAARSYKRIKKAEING